MAEAVNLDYLMLDDSALLRQCEVHTYKSSGPGGQHRNKVSSAVRLKHPPTGLMAHGDESRSQHENKAMALRRLRMNIALRLRRRLEAQSPAQLPPVVRQCLFIPRKLGPQAGPRLEIGRKDYRFWAVAAFLLDVLESFQGRLADSAASIGISTGNLTSILESDRHLLGAAQEIRKRYGQKPLK